MTLTSQVSRPSTDDWHILALLSTARGRRAALYSSLQCLLSVIGSLGVIMLFAAVPQFIYYREVSLTSVFMVFCGVLFLTIMIGGNYCLGHRIRAQLIQAAEAIREQTEAALNDDKPPSYDELSFTDSLPDYYSVVSENKKRGSVQDLRSLHHMSHSSLHSLSNSHKYDGGNSTTRSVIAKTLRKVRRSRSASAADSAKIQLDELISGSGANTVSVSIVPKGWQNRSRPVTRTVSEISYNPHSEVSSKPSGNTFRLNSQEIGHLL